MAEPKVKKTRVPRQKKAQIIVKKPAQPAYVVDEQQKAAFEATILSLIDKFDVADLKVKILQVLTLQWIVNAKLSYQSNSINSCEKAAKILLAIIPYLDKKDDQEQIDVGDIIDKLSMNPRKLQNS